MNIPIPCVHGVPKEYHTEKPAGWVHPPEREGTVPGEEERRREQDSEDCPESVLEFLCMMDAA